MTDSAIEIRPQPGAQEAFLSSEADIAIYGGSAGSGKALDVDTPIPTITGWKKIGDIVSGDVVFDELGYPCRVTHAFAPFVAQSYRLVFDDSELIACADHEWFGYTAGDLIALTNRTDKHRAERRKNRPPRGSSEARSEAMRLRYRRDGQATLPLPAGRTVTTADLLEMFPCKRSPFAIPVASFLDLPHVDLPLDPYCLGLWLGDGTTNDGSFTTSDDETVQAFRSAGFESIKRPSSKYAYGIHGLRAKLREIGVFGNKHVPMAYKRASMQQRLAVLQGLMDSDGSADGSVEFCNTDIALVNDVLELFHSLGMKANAKQSRAMLNGKDCGPRWRIVVTPRMPVFRLNRKLSRQGYSSRRTTKYHYLRKIEPAGVRQMRCISVDSTSHLYLAGEDMVPTHNSFALLMEPLRHVHNKNFGAVFFRRTFPQIMAEGALWDEAARLYPLVGGKASVTPVPMYTFPSGASVRFSHLQYDKSKLDWQGSQVPLILWDELTQFSWEQFTYLMSRNRSMCGVRPYMRGSCNPDPDSWVRSFLAWWIGADGFPIAERSGVLRWMTVVNNDVQWADSREELIQRLGPDIHPLSVTFIPALLKDNPKLLEADPGYIAKLQALPEHERKALLEGNWDARAVAGSYFKREWFQIVTVADAGTKWVRYWDRAATEPSPSNRDPDWTVGALVGKQPNGRFVIGDIVRLRGTPHKVEAAIKATASRDGKKVRIGLEQEPGASGKMEAGYLAQKLAGYNVKVYPKRKGKEEDWTPLSAQAEAGNVDMVRAPWNDALLNEMEALPLGAHDDQADACSGAFGVIVSSTAYTLSFV